MQHHFRHLERAVRRTFSTPSKLVALVGVLLFMSSCATSPFHEGNRFDTTVMANASWRHADNDFDPVDEQRAFGLEADVRLPHDDVGLELGFTYASRDGTRNSGGGDADVEAKTYEFNVGGRWKYGQWVLGSHPYASAGVSLSWLTTNSDGPRGESDSSADWAIGPYIRLGIEWPIVGGLSIALDYRQVMFTQWFHDVDIDDLHTDANYNQAGVVLGWAF